MGTFELLKTDRNVKVPLSPFNMQLGITLLMLTIQIPGDCNYSVTVLKQRTEDRVERKELSTTGCRNLCMDFVK